MMIKTLSPCKVFLKNGGRQRKAELFSQKVGASFDEQWQRPWRVKIVSGSFSFREAPERQTEGIRRACPHNAVQRIRSMYPKQKVRRSRPVPLYPRRAHAPPAPFSVAVGGLPALVCLPRHVSERSLVLFKPTRPA
jgi:hypothetical protein